jgi:hypothetical protein
MNKWRFGYIVSNNRLDLYFGEHFIACIEDPVLAEEIREGINNIDSLMVTPDKKPNRDEQLNKEEQKSEVIERVCRNCDFVKTSKTNGRCCRFPPHIINGENWPTFPLVAHENWCGEFKPKKRG